MARPRGFAEDDVLALAAAVFARLGYNASSVDDLVAATGLQRGSLYKAFGSKRNLFERVMRQTLLPGWHQRTQSVDLLITALKELAPDDFVVTALCHDAVASCHEDTASLLGRRLLEHLTHH
jgi:TetR/AcrR family transcriptional repressor of nem operon